MNDYISQGFRVGKQIEDELLTTQEEANNNTDRITKLEQQFKGLSQKGLKDLSKSFKPPQDSLRINIKTTSYDELLFQASKKYYNIKVTDCLSNTEIEMVNTYHKKLCDNLDNFSSLDKWDIFISSFSGIMAGVLDVLFLNKITDNVKLQFNKILSPNTIKELEKTYKVNYDFSTSKNLNKNVAGMSPKTHRLQSLGHDPILGFIFGVWDIIKGNFSAIDKYGKLIIQSTSSSIDTITNIFIQIFNAIKVVAGHLASDINTSQGLPFPFASLLTMIPKIKDIDISRMVRKLYIDGYDLRRFLASSIPVILTEIVIRIFYFVKSLYNDRSFIDALPIASKTDLRRMLLIGHTVATSINLGHVYFTKNFFNISFAQCYAFIRYLVPEIRYMINREGLRETEIQNNILANYQIMNLKLKEELSNRENFYL